MLSDLLLLLVLLAQTYVLARLTRAVDGLRSGIQHHTAVLQRVSSVCCDEETEETEETRERSACP